MEPATLAALVILGATQSASLVLCLRLYGRVKHLEGVVETLRGNHAAV